MSPLVQLVLAVFGGALGVSLLLALARVRRQRRIDAASTRQMVAWGRVVASRDTPVAATGGGRRFDRVEVTIALERPPELARQVVLTQSFALLDAFAYAAGTSVEVRFDDEGDDPRIVAAKPPFGHALPVLTTRLSPAGESLLLLFGGLGLGLLPLWSAAADLLDVERDTLFYVLPVASGVVLSLIGVVVLIGAVRRANPPVAQMRFLGDPIPAARGQALVTDAMRGLTTYDNHFSDLTLAVQPLDGSVPWVTTQRARSIAGEYACGAIVVETEGAHVGALLVPTWRLAQLHPDTLSEPGWDEETTDALGQACRRYRLSSSR